MKVWHIFLYNLVIIIVYTNLPDGINAKAISDPQYTIDNDPSVAVALKDPDMSQVRIINKEASSDDASVASVASVAAAVAADNPGPLYKFPKMNQHSSLQSYDLPSAKRATATAAAAESDPEDKRYKNGGSVGYTKYKRRRSPFGIVYQDGKPFGILEPISRIYEFQNLPDDMLIKNKRENGDVAVRSDSDADVKRDIDMAKGLEPQVLTQNKLNDPLKTKPMSEDVMVASKGEAKRNVEKSTKSPVTKREPTAAPSAGNANANSDTKLSAIENNLKEIMNDLKTINEEDSEDEAVDKREIINEDEDLDSGSNKIGIKKEIHAKKFDVSKALSAESSLKQKKSDVLNAGEEKIADYRNEGETFIREKRQQAINSRNEGNDIVKGLEASGDLTVSGNKSPLASASAPVETEIKKIKGDNYDKRDKQAAEDAEYEKRLQRNIQGKIGEIKEQVKREIKALNTNQKKADAADDGHLKNNNDEQSDRKKRNLMERAALDPSLDVEHNTESDALIPHVRQRRHLGQKTAVATDNGDGKPVGKEPGDASGAIGEATDKVVDVNKREDILQAAEYLSKSKREAGDFQAAAPNSNVATKPVAEQPEVDAPANARAVRDTKPAAVGAAAGLDLEKLVKESASLTESIKNERGAHYNELAPHIEVELHSGTQKAQTSRKPVKSDSSEVLTHDDEDAAALAKNAKPVVKRETRAKSGNAAAAATATEKKQFQAAEDKTKGGDAAGLSEGVAAIAANGREQNHKLFEANDAKMAAEAGKNSEATAAVSAEAKTIEIRTDSPEVASDNADKDEKVKSSGSEKNSDSKVAEEADNDDGDMNKRAIDIVNVSNEAVDKQDGGQEQDAANVEDSDSKVRQERKSEPNLSLEDMQEMDSENKMKRRRRHVDYYYPSREKRAQYGRVPNYMRFRNYRGDEDEADDESDEFDDDNFDDRTANIVRKRATRDIEGYDDVDAEYANSQEQEGDTEREDKLTKRNANNARALVAKKNDDAYVNSNYLYDAHGMPLNRNKRQVFEDLAALHSGGPMIRHLAAIKERNAHMDKENTSNRRKRLEKQPSVKSGTSNNIKGQMISGLSDTDVFGGLPQSYEGELTRFKRVKRDDPSPIDDVNDENR